MDIRKRNTEAVPQVAKPVLASGMKTADLADTRLCMLGVRLAFALGCTFGMSTPAMSFTTSASLRMCVRKVSVARWPAPFVHGILGIVCTGPKPKMCAIYTTRIITGMAHKKSRGDGAKGNSPCDSLSSVGFTANPKAPVAASEPTSGPFPAVIWATTHDFGPESRFVFVREGRDDTMFSGHDNLLNRLSGRAVWRPIRRTALIIV